MFGLLHNCYTFCKTKSERKVTIALFGLDNAGKTTILNTLKGHLNEDATPTFGFNSSTLQEGKYKLEVFDLGGGKNIRSVWKKYLAEVHAIVYVVDAADAARFEEAKKAMTDVLENQYMHDKPILVFANKQDLPTAASAPEVVNSLGLTACKNSHNVFACTAKAPPGQAADTRLREGLRWLIACVDRNYSRLNPRVQADAEAVRQEEARKRREREERVRQQREERLRQQKEEEERAQEIEKENVLHDGKGPSLLAAAASAPQTEPEHVLPPVEAQDPLMSHLHLHHGLALGLPHTIESPGKLPPVRRPMEPPPTPDLLPAVLDQGTWQAPSGSTGGSGTASGGAALLPIGRAPSGTHLATGGSLAARPVAPSPARGNGEDSAGPASSSTGGQGGTGLAVSRPASAAGSRVTGGGVGGQASSGGGSGGGFGGSGQPSSGTANSKDPQAEQAGSNGGGSGDGGDEQTCGPSQRSRLPLSSGGSAGDAAPRGSFSLVHQNNRIVPVADDSNAE